MPGKDQLCLQCDLPVNEGLLMTLQARISLGNIAIDLLDIGIPLLRQYPLRFCADLKEIYIPNRIQLLRHDTE